MSPLARRRDQDDRPASNPKAGTITEIQPQRRDRERVSIYIDGVFSFGVHVDIQLDHCLTKGDVLDDEKIAMLLEQDRVKKAIATSLNLVAYRPRATGELATKLRERGYETGVIDAAVARMHELGYLDDRQFANRWVESRRLHRPRSTRMLKRELQDKGVDREVIESSIDDANIDEFSDALALATKKMTSLASLAPETRERRLSGFLARRGYGYDTIRRVLEELHTGD